MSDIRTRLLWPVIKVQRFCIAETPIHPVRQQIGAASGLWGNVLARVYRRGERLGVHVHREAQLLFAPRGMIQVTTPKGRWLVPPQRAVWLPPRIEHAVDMLTDIEMRTLYLQPNWLSAHSEASRLGREFVVSVGPLLRQLLLAACSDNADARPSCLPSWRYSSSPRPRMPRLSCRCRPTRARRRVAELVLANPAGRRDLEDLGRAAGASPRTITRLFPAATNLTFKEYRQRARIMAAVEALGGGQASIKQISGRLGFSSSAAFGHAFRQVIGTTPGEFLRSAARTR